MIYYQTIAPWQIKARRPGERFLYEEETDKEILIKLCPDELQLRLHEINPNFG